MIELFEDQLRQDLHQFLQSMKEIDARLPECPDVEDKWEPIARAYIPDGIKEFNDFPSASLGWMMYIGMAIASEHRTRNQRGFQCLRFLSASTLPVWSRYAVEQDGLSHDKDELG